MESSPATRLPGMVRLYGTDTRIQPGGKGKEDDPKSAWRGDHSFSAGAAAYSLSEFIIPEIKKTHPDWPASAVHEEAVRRFERRLSQDLSYEQSERNHEDSTVRWSVVETAPGVRELATQYGDGMITLRQLWEHTRQYAEAAGNPAAYNACEADAQMSMQDRFIRGDSGGFVSILSHPDGVRYVQIWDVADGGTVTSRQVDLYAVTGRDFSQEEGATLVKHLESFRRTTDTNTNGETNGYAHFFITSGVIDAGDVRMIAVAQTMTNETLSDTTIETIRYADVPFIAGRETSRGQRRDDTEPLIVRTSGIRRTTEADSRGKVRKSKNNPIRHGSVRYDPSGESDSGSRIQIPYLPVFGEIVAVARMNAAAREFPVSAVAVLTLLTEGMGIRIPVAGQEKPASFTHVTQENYAARPEAPIPGAEVSRTAGMLFLALLRFIRMPAGVKDTEQGNSRRNTNQDPQPVSAAVPNPKDSAVIRGGTPVSVWERMFVWLAVRFLPQKNSHSRTDTTVESRDSITDVIVHGNEYAYLFRDETPSFSPESPELRGYADAVVGAMLLWRSIIRSADTHVVGDRSLRGANSLRESGNAAEGVWIMLAIVRYLTLIRESGRSVYTAAPIRRKRRIGVRESRMSGMLMRVPSRTIMYGIASW